MKRAGMLWDVGGAFDCAQGMGLVGYSGDCHLASVDGHLLGHSSRPFHGYHCRLHGGHDFLLVVADGKDVAATDGDGTSGADDFAACQEVAADGGGEEVDFVFDGEHFGVGFHEAEGGESAGVVYDGGDDAGVHVAVVLRERIVEW